MQTTAALRLVTLGAVLALVFTGCVRREGRNADCTWPESNARPMDLSHGADVRHLQEDVELAEELAVRHMDAQQGLPPAQRRPGQSPGEVMNACRNSLLKQVSTLHGVTAGEILPLFGRRSLAADSIILILFFLLYALAAVAMAAWLLRRYPPEESMTATVVMGLLCSLAIGTGGLLLGEQWSITAESIRLGTGHLSYRVERLPWVQHRLGFFVVCVAVFWSAAGAWFWARARRRRV